MTCPLCCEGWMETKEPENDIGNYSSDESFQSTSNINESPEVIEEKPLSDDHQSKGELQHIVMRNDAPNMKRKRGRPRKLEGFGEVSSDKYCSFFMSSMPDTHFL